MSKNAVMERTVTTKIRLGKKKSDRFVSFSYADEAADEPGELYFNATVRSPTPGTNAVTQGGYVVSHGSLSAEESETLKGLLDKLFAKAIVDEGFPPSE